jgi:hypothetical protein
VIIGKPVEVARGQQPGVGTDASFELLFEMANDKSPVMGDDGYIDYKSLDLISNATMGQPLAKKIPAKLGEPGKTVTGQVVEGKPGKDRALPKGTNTDISPDNPNLLIAAKDGAITYSNNLVSIDSVYKINSDVDMSTGNIDFVGSLKIAGSVSAGFKIKAAGNIEIGKNIEDALIISEGSVAATGGFVGSGKGKITAAEDVFVKYVENQVIEAGHDVNIGGGAMNAQIVAANAVFLKGRKAVIVGGNVTAGNLIEVSVLGSELGTPTLVRVGYNQALMNRIREIDQEIKRLQEDAEKIHKAMYSLVRLDLDNKLNESQKEALRLLKEQQQAIPKQSELLIQKKKDLFAKLNENKKAKIVVKGTVYPGTIIQIGTMRKEIEKILGSCTFVLSHDKVVVLTG